MKTVRILGIETSGPVCSVALLTLARKPGDFVRALAEGGCLEREHVQSHARHSEAVFKLLDRVFRAARTGIGSVDAVAVSLGPGSFTGLRIGLAVAKVLARFGGKRLVGVPTLMALAAGEALVAGAKSVSGLGERRASLVAGAKSVSGLGERRASLVAGAPLYAAVVDAQRGELYAALYRRVGVRGQHGQMTKVRGPWVCRAGDLEAYLPAGSRIASGPPRASVVAALGAVAFLGGKYDDPDRMVPLYVRRPEAVETRRRLAAAR